MSGADRVYTVDVILGDPEAPALWNWSQWTQVVSLLDPIMKVARGRPGVESTQFIGKKYVRFGALAWNEKSQQKWTHNSPLSTLAADSSQWKFLSSQIWAPSRGSCGREDSPPDFFFHLVNQGFWESEDTLKFNPRVVIAIAEDLPDECLEQEKMVAKSIGEMVNAKLHAYKSRSWALRFFGAGYMNTIADIADTGGLFRAGPIHLQEPNLAIFEESREEGEWKIRE